MSNAIATKTWQTLAAHGERARTLHLRDLFAADPQRFQRFSFEQGGLLLDLSKQRLTPEAFAALHGLWWAADLPAWQARLQAGEAINHTEGRAVLHHALRYQGNRAILQGNHDVMPLVRAVLEQMRRFCAAIHSGEWRGATGEQILDVVNIGIGGSDLGPKMASEALAAHRVPHLKVHYVSNLDGAHLASVLAGLSPRTTLFVIASKTFTTQETMQNAASARRWLVEALGEAAVRRHFVAVSTNLAEVAKFGIDPDNAFAFWDWVGGRFSVWSAIGLPVALTIGFDHFQRFLAGAAAMDVHFFEAPAERNLPFLLAAIDVWNNNFLGAETRACLPYSQSLELLPRYLQQLEMDSTGKRVGRDAVIDRLLPYKVFPGNQPSTTLLLPRLDPYHLGQLIALYEHKVFTLGTIWNLNAYDQWGVELGKQLASRLLPIVEGRAGTDGLDSSTAGLITACRK
jgi:glucose-6-phosphate isomerase